MSQLNKFDDNILNLQNLSTELSKFENKISNNFLLFDIYDYELIVDGLLNRFFGHIKIDSDVLKVNLNENKAGLYTYINNDYVDLFLSNEPIININRITINRLVPTTIINLFEKDVIKSRKSDFPILYKFLVDNYQELKKCDYVTKKQILIIKMIINYTFIALTKSQFAISNHMRIGSYLNCFFDYLIKKYPNDIIQINIDEISFKDNSDLINDVSDFLNVHGYKYEIDKNIRLDWSNHYFYTTSFD